MGNSNGNIDAAFSFRSLERLGDLTWFEGPLLTLFRQIETGKLYLFDWVDCVGNANVWMMYPVSKKSLKGFVAGELSRLNLLENVPGKRIRLVHLDDNLQCVFSEWVAVNDLPPAYLPPADSYFDLADCPSPEAFSGYLETEEIA